MLPEGRMDSFVCTTLTRATSRHGRTAKSKYSIRFLFFCVNALDPLYDTCCIVKIATLQTYHTLYYNDKVAGSPQFCDPVVLTGLMEFSWFP